MELSTATDLIKHPSINTNNMATWADLGCGSGLFTHALSTLLAKPSTIYAVDSNASALKKVLVSQAVTLNKVAMDFVNDDLPFDKIDGILMANSLHYVKEKDGLIAKLKKHLATKGQLLILEYDTTRANMWVPYPIPFISLSKLLAEQGFGSIMKLGETRSAFRQGNIYSVLATQKN